MEEVELSERKDVLTSGNSEIDKRLGGGIPLKTLTLIEGENDTGKSVLCQQFAYGSLISGHNVAYYTTENTQRSLLSQMESLGLDVSDFFAWGYLRIFPIHLEGIEWSADQMRKILKLLTAHIKKEREDVVIIDSLTMFTTYSTEDDILEFLTKLKNICDAGKTILITLHQHHPLLVLYLIFLVAITDSGAYFTGKAFGKNKLAPELSPGKTREGMFGGVVGAVVWSVLSAWFFGLSSTDFFYFILLSLAVAFMSVAGDLFESLIKREAGQKDSGNILPGHGGILDRVDGLIATLPLFTLGIFWGAVRV